MDLVLVVGILTLIVAILTLVATIAVPIIMKLQTSRIELSEQIKKFLRDNKDELDYLSLCAMAVDSIDSPRTHIRKIFKNFNECSGGLQKALLKYKKIPVTVPLNKEWVDEYIQRFRDDAQKYELGIDMLYDRGKYFHRALERYAECKTEKFDTHIFEPLIPRNNKFLDGYKDDLWGYICDYFDYIGKTERAAKMPESNCPPIPPYDKLNYMKNLTSCGEDELSFWVMQIITETCAAFRNLKIVAQDDADWRKIDTGDAPFETFEDLYYYTLLCLYTAYAERPNYSKHSA